MTLPLCSPMALEISGFSPEVEHAEVASADVAGILIGCLLRFDVLPNNLDGRATTALAKQDRVGRNRANLASHYI